MGGWGKSLKEKIQSSVVKCTMIGAAFGSIILHLYHTSIPAKFFAVSVIDFFFLNCCFESRFLSLMRFAHSQWLTSFPIFNAGPLTQSVCSSFASSHCVLCT